MQYAAVLVQGDDIAESYCADCLTPCEEWIRSRSYHPVSRPGAMGDGELFCAECVEYASDPETGVEVCTFCGTPDHIEICPTAGIIVMIP